jgi:hypothetical protein
MGVSSIPDMRRQLAALCQAADLASIEQLGDAIDFPAVINEAASYGRSRNNPRRLDPVGLLSLIDHRP